MVKFYSFYFDIGKILLIFVSLLFANEQLMYKVRCKYK